MEFISYLIKGVSLGSVYAIIALGYTMVYGIAKMLNFAHGDVIMIGGFITFTSMSTLGLDPITSCLLTVVFCTVLGVLIERIAYKPLRKAPPLAVLITAIGVSYFLQNIVQLIFGTDTKSYTSVIDVSPLSLFDGELIISGETIVTIISGIIIMFGISIFINKSKTGKAMLAVSEDKEASQLMGINVNKTIAITFAIGSSFAAVASLLMFSAYPSLTYTSGSMPGIKAFIAAVFGGIGSVPGAVIGGVLLGIIEIYGKAYISSQLAEAIVFGILIIVLVIKPTGLLGRQIKEKV